MSWTNARLDEVAEIILGQSPPGSSYNEEGEGVPFFQGKAEFSELRPTIRKWTTAPSKLAQTDDVLMSVRAPVGPTNLAPCECAIGRGLAAIRPLGGIDSRYVLWAIRATASDLAALGTGSTFEAVTGGQVKAHTVPVAPLNEQRRIVAAIEEHLSRLDAADETLAQAKQRIDGLRSALITSGVELGDWPRVRWKEAGRSQNGRAFPSRDYSVEGIRLLRPGNLHISGRVEWNNKNTRHLPDRYADEHPRFIVGENEIVMNLTAQSLRDEFLGRVCMTGHGERCLLNQRIARLSPSQADPQFVLYAFKSRRFREFVKSLNTGSLIQHMFTSQLDEYELSMPPLEEQRRIVAEIEERLGAIDALRAAIERAQRRGAALCRSVLERAFRGELVPQDPSDEPASVLLDRIRAERSAAPARRLTRRVRR